MGLVINANLEAVGTPVHRVGAALGLDVGTGGVDVFGNHITTVQPAGKPIERGDPRFPGWLPQQREWAWMAGGK